MANLSGASYTAKEFNLSDLKGISNETLEIHFGLYKGYVTNTNTLNEKLAEMIKGGQAGTPAYAELTRRLGFEYNGMVLHEYYFGNMKKDGSAEPTSGSPFITAAEASFGDLDTWKKDFVGIGTMRGVGWAVCYQDPQSGRLSNHWITLHEEGNIAGFNPVLVLDVWEHAFLRDYKPAERPKYIEAFFSNIDWEAVAGRLVVPKAQAKP
jgi:superoxide dismutase, Fe-Mn family